MIKRRDLEEQIERLNAKVEELTAQLEKYRSREQAIVQTLTDAQATANRRVEEAEERAKGIVFEAQKQREALLEENATLQQEANGKAAAIIEDAQAEAQRRLLQAEASVADYAARVAALNQALQATADQAREQAEAFAAAMEGKLSQPDEIVQETGGKGLGALITQPPQDLPADYASPADLMHGIYQLQGRDIPKPAQEQPSQEEQHPTQALEQAASQPDEPQEERVWTVDEVMANTASADQQAPAADLDKLLEDIIG